MKANPITLLSLLQVGKYLAINPRKAAVLSGLSLYVFAAVHHLVFPKSIPPAPKVRGLIRIFDKCMKTMIACFFGG